MAHKLALIGFGTVGQGFAEILQSKADRLKQEQGFEATIVAVADTLKGSAYSPQGLKLDELLELVRSGESLNDYGGAESGWDALRTIRESNADTVCELTYTDIETGQPATDHCRAALGSGKHVVTSNKGPAALHYRELSDMAADHGVRFLIEGTVMSGTPVLNLARNELAGNQISAIRGILNGTTNYILTKMEEGQSYEEALSEAKRLGYAEADPTADVEGLDALAKVTILANVVMGESLTPKDTPCQGISHLSAADVESARSESKRWKLIGEIRRNEDGVSASVAPVALETSHPLAGVSGAVNALTFSTDLLGDVTMVGPGAGKMETGFSILTDLLELHRNPKGTHR